VKSPLNLLPVVIALLSLLAVAQPASANEKYAAMVVDANTGQTLFARNADARRYPASLTKMMTLYAVFEELDAGRLGLRTQLSVSANAAAQPPSELGLRAGASIKVEDAIQALTTKSANDVAVVVAEHIGGSVSGFAARMNRTARALGMNSTTFRNPHGLPDSGQVTTARDLVKLAQALQDRFPTYYSYFSVRSFTYRGTRYRNHNRLLGSVEGVDGIKTGYIRASGFNLVTNVKRDGRHIIAVVMGGKTAASRDAHMRDLIATYLPQARRGRRSTPLLIVDSGEVGMQTAEARLPRARPVEQSAAVLAYASAAPTRDLVTAAMAAPAPTPRPDPEQGDVSEGSENQATEDPIAARIETATEIAALAADPPAAKPQDSIARLTELARVRAGDQDIVAAPPIAAAATQSGEAGWHIQIAAVPTLEGAEALLEQAQADMGPVLASLQPLTQEVDRDGTTLYRARFAGFSGKEEARATCAKLERQSIDCLAVPN
jgi:D-alanyl-D-alanine carboxypeptidase